MLPKHWLIRLLSLYPPYLGAGIRVRKVGTGFQVRMKLHWWNRNDFGTHFGGSLYSMCDPFFVLILAEQLGRDYIVWDKAATIRFRRPGRGRVQVEFQLPPEEIAVVRAKADAGEVVEPTYTAQVVNGEGKVVAEVEKLCYVRRKWEGWGRLGAFGSGLGQRGFGSRVEETPETEPSDHRDSPPPGHHGNRQAIRSSLNRNLL